MTYTTTEQHLLDHPYLASPVYLAMTDTLGKWKMARHLEIVNDKLLEMALSMYPDHTPKRLGINLPFQVGKQIAKNQLIMTTRGWTLHGLLRIGDEVYSPTGKPVKVLAIGPDSIQDCEVVFSDGAVIRCKENHEWNILSSTVQKWRRMETKNLESVKLSGVWSGSVKNYYQVSACARIGSHGPFERRAVVSVRRSTPIVGNCIQVEGGEYLVGETLIPTHNSELCSKYFPAWLLLLRPETRIIVVANTEALAASFGSKIKDLIEKFGPPHGIHLKDDTKAKGEWKIAKHGGGVLCRGIGGALVGHPCDLAIIDGRRSLLQSSIREAVGLVQLDAHGPTGAICSHPGRDDPLVY
jgi:hypothetical protein